MHVQSDCTPGQGWTWGCREPPALQGSLSLLCLKHIPAAVSVSSSDTLHASLPGVAGPFPCPHFQDQYTHRSLVEGVGTYSALGLGGLSTGTVSYFVQTVREMGGFQC